MSLPGSPDSPAPRWAPTHVQVTVLQARGLRAKAKGGSGGGSDAYAVMALGKEKFATSVAERCLGSPVWREEATFELPSPPRRGLGRGHGTGPLAVLQLTVFHRALLGLDKFLGRAEISLGELQTEGGRRTTRWYKLHSKPGKKEKERGEIEVDIQFMRSNMTASMFDLSMKDKPRTSLGKLKDKMKGKRGNRLPDTASAIIPSISHSPADSEEELNEKEKKKSKFKTLFSKPGLHKSSISQSMSVLPTLQPVSERVRLRPSDFQSQWSDDDDSTLTPVSEKPSSNRTDNNVFYPPSVTSHKRTGSGDAKQLSQIIAGSSKKDMHSLFGLKSKNDPISRSNLCINGSHVYMEECESKSDTIPKDGTSSSPPSQTSQQKRLFLSQENLSLESGKELEISDKVPSGSSLESFKAMTLPSYKLLAGEDFLENNTPLVSDTPKETKENKKQENKKAGFLSLVTGKKETKINEEMGNPETSLKVKEVKHNEKEATRKETNPFEVPVDSRRGHDPDRSSATGDVVTKTSTNPFNENIMEGEKPEKSAVSVKPPQMKLVKPRLGMSSEDETKATFSFPVPSPPPSFPLSCPPDDENDFKFDVEQKTQEVSRFDHSKNVSVQPNNNPFIIKWGQESRKQNSECSVASACLPAPASGNENNPFSPKWRQESQAQDTEISSLKFLHSSVVSFSESHTFPSQVSNIDDHFVAKVGNDPATLRSLSENIDHSKHTGGIFSEKLQTEALINETDSGDPGSSISGSLSGGLPQSCDLVSLNQNAVNVDKIHIMLPFKEDNSGMKKSVTFTLDELKKNGISSHSNDEDPFEIDEDEEAVNSTERSSSHLIKLNMDDFCASKPDEEMMNYIHNSGNPLRKEVESGSSAKIKQPVPTKRTFLTLPAETNISSTELSDETLSVPPKPAPRSGLKEKKTVCLPLTDESRKGAISSSASVLKEISSDNSIFNEKPSHIGSLAASETAVLPCGKDDGIMNLSQSTNDYSNHTIRTQPGELNVKSIALPVIFEVASDDEQLGDYQQKAEKIAICEDLSKTEDNSMTLWSFTERTELASTKKAINQTISSLVQRSDIDGAPKRLLVDPSAAVFQNPNHNIIGLGQMSGDNSEEKRDECPEFSDEPVPLSPLPVSFKCSSIGSFQSDSLGSNQAESPKKATAEGLDAKVECSGKTKLLQAWVSPSETHPNQSLQTGGKSAKLRLHPVKPMNATTNKPSSKPLNINTKILDKQTEPDLKKYNPTDPAYAYAQLTHDELIQLVLKQKDVLAKRDLQVRELEDYIDNLLVRVMEETPNILRIQVHTSKKAGKI